MVGLPLLVVALGLAGAEPGPGAEPAAPACPDPCPPAPLPPKPILPRLEFGQGGFLEFNAIAHVWASLALDDYDVYSRRGTARSTFRLRRAELYATGAIVPKLAYFLMVDPARVMEFTSQSVRLGNVDSAGPARSPRVSVLQPTSGASILSDLYVTLKVIPYVDVYVGQARLPISGDTRTPIKQLLFAERSEIGRMIGDWRDLGVWAGNKTKYVGWYLGLYNGSGIDSLDFDVNKDVSGRLEFYAPWVGLTLAASFLQTLPGQDAWFTNQQARLSGTWRSLGAMPDALGKADSWEKLGNSMRFSLPSDSQGSRSVAGIEALLKYRGLTAQAEGYVLRLFNREIAPRQRVMVGTFVAAAYNLGTYFDAQWEPAGRMEWFDPDLRTYGDDFVRVTLGWNIKIPWLHVKLQPNWIHTHQYIRDLEDIDKRLLPAVDDLFLLSLEVAL